MEAVLRYESYKRTEEQKKLSKFLNDDQTDHMQETKNVTEETLQKILSL